MLGLHLLEVGLWHFTLISRNSKIIGFKINQQKSQFRNLLKIHLLFRLSLVSLSGYWIKIMFY